VEPRALLGPCADFKQLVGSFLDAMPALRGHQAPEEIRMTARRASTFLVRRRTPEAGLIVGPAFITS
jgi:hypothetical protein